MRTAFISEGCGISGIRLRDLPEPELDGASAGKALVRLTAATLNFRDLIMVKALIPGIAKQPEVIPLSCAAGEVIAVGEGVTRVTAGDRVSPLFAQGWLSGTVPSPDMLGGSADGVARPVAIFDAENLVRIPDTLGDFDAATYPCAGLTAWAALFGARPLAAGEWVILQGTGGVSIAALQFAKAAGARVAITSSSPAKLARAAALGADLTVDYRATPDWAAAVREGLDGEPAAILVDTAGASEVDAAAALLADDGIVAAIGMLGGDFSWSRPEIAGRRVVPIGVGNREQHEAMLGFVAAHRIRPVVDAGYDLDRLADAYRHLESGNFFGKIGINLR